MMLELQRTFVFSEMIVVPTVITTIPSPIFLRFVQNYES